MIRTLFTLTAAAVIGLFSATAEAQVLFSDNLDDGTGWSVNNTTADFQVTFGYDYSADDIPEAPNSQGGDSATTGIKAESNLVNGAANAYTIFPVGQSFTGDYQLRFDAWMNYDVDERINGGSAGTTEFIGGGLGYDDTTADVGIGAQVIATGDGGSGSDWRAFGDGSFLDAAEMVAGSRNGFDPHYSDFLTGVSPPAGQTQLTADAGTAGSPGFQWITFEITSVAGVAEVVIEKPGGDRLAIANINEAGSDPYTSDGNIGLFYADFFSSVTTRPDLTFGLFDNVVVTQVGSALLGDADGDGDVDGDDLIAVQTEFGATGMSPLLGDADGDGDVDGDDLIAVQTNFGNVTATSVPEPAGLALLALGALAVSARRSR